MLLSVIIPFYHVEAYISACLERVAQMPAQVCEVLLVDDCGQDGSAQIAAAYAAKHANFRIIRREKNGGLSAARNTGLAQAKGEFVYFLDSDDLPEPDALMAMARRAQADALDVVKARFTYFDDETGAVTPGPAIEETGVVPGGMLFAAQCRSGIYEPMVWQCVYRRTFLEENQLTMAEGLLFEDELFQAPALLCAKRTAAMEVVALRYRQREGSIMKSFSKSAAWCASYLEVCRRLSALAEKAEQGEAAAALRRRVGQIALSVAKNIPAYRLTPEAAKDSRAFLQANLGELAGYAICSRDVLVCAQGLLLRAVPGVFMALYTRLT